MNFAASDYFLLLFFSRKEGNHNGGTVDVVKLGLPFKFLLICNGRPEKKAKFFGRRRTVAAKV